MVSESVRSVAQGQHERHVTHHGRGILEIIVELGMLAVGAAFGVSMGDSFELSDLAMFFGPILWVALFAVPLAALSLARPFTALRDSAKGRPGAPWFNLAYIGRLALIVFFIAVAAVPVLVLFREAFFGRFGLDTAIPDILVNERVGVATLLMGWVLIAWVTAKVAHHLAIAGSPEQTNQNDRVVLATKALLGGALLTILRWVKRRAREHKNRPRDPVITDAPRSPAGLQRPPTYAPPSPPQPPPMRPMPVGTAGGAPVYRTVADAEEATGTRPMIIPPPGERGPRGPRGLDLDELMERARDREGPVLERGL